MFSSTTRRCLAPRTTHFARSHVAARQFQTASRLSYPAKDSMDKDSLKPESNEYSKSGSDSKTAAATEEAAFDPDTTRPETEHDQAGKETKGTDKNNPLNVSPANHDVSQPRGEQEGGSQGSPTEHGRGGERSGASGGGSPSKAGGGKSGVGGNL